MFNFRAQVHISGQDNGKFYFGKSHINYTVEIETRSWGIKSIYISVPDQSIEFTDVGDVERKIQLKDVEVDYDVDNETIVLRDIEEHEGQWTAY